MAQITVVSSGYQGPPGPAGVGVLSETDLNKITADVTASVTTQLGTKLDSAVQGIKVNGTLQAPDTNGQVNLTGLATETFATTEATEKSNAVLVTAQEYADNKKTEAATYTEQKLTEANAYTDAEITKAKTYADTTAANNANTVLTSAKTYADQKVAAQTNTTLTEAKSYTDTTATSKANTALTDAKTYADIQLNTAKTYADNSATTKADAALAAAKTYADQKVAAAGSSSQGSGTSGAVDTTAAVTQANAYTDAEITKAKTYADTTATTKADAALTDAKTYADTTATTKADAALTDAKTYTDGQITTLNSTITNMNYATQTYADTSATDKSNAVLDTAKAYADTKKLESDAYADGKLTEAKTYTDAQIAANTTTGGNYATTTYVDQQISTLLTDLGLTRCSFVINNAYLIASTNNNRSWEFTTTIPNEKLIFDAGTKSNYFSSLTANGFTVNSTGAGNRTGFPVYIDIKVDTGLQVKTIGQAIINYSSNGALPTNINTELYVAT